MDIYDAAFAVLVTFYVVLCPFTKVEESPNLQATHDILEYGTGADYLENYDHFEFPGVVPRTFIGPLFLSTTCWPVIRVIKWLDTRVDKLAFQYIIRITLGLFGAFALARFRESIRVSFGHRISVVFALFSLCQFHTAFWMSRTLPNMFAFPLTTLGFAHWVSSVTSSNANRQLILLIFYLTFAIVVFRCELVLLLGPIVLYELWKKKLRLIDGMVAGVLAGLVSLVLSVLVDSYFWQTPWLWPEGVVFYFNVFLGNSSKWGILPFHAYFTNFLPRLLLTSLPLSLFAVITDKRTHKFMLVSFLFVLEYSFLGHKEWRFIVYIVPLVNMCAAIGWVWIEQHESNLIYHVIKKILIGCLIVSFLASITMAGVSSYNYPGGVALRRLHIIERDYRQAQIHQDTFSCMTGVSRYGWLRNDWSYFKNETHTASRDYIQYTHLLTSKPELHQEQFEVIETVYGYEKILIKNINDVIANWFKLFSGNLQANRGHSWSLLISGLLPIEIDIKPKIWIMRRLASRK